MQPENFCCYCFQVNPAESSNLLLVAGLADSHTGFKTSCSLCIIM